MKNWIGTALALALVTGVARAEEEAKYLPNLVALDAVRSEAKVEVLKTQVYSEGVSVLFSIPVKVDLKSACTWLAGQSTSWVKVGRFDYAELKAVGAVDPQQEACIEIYPLPRDTNFTYVMTLKNPEAGATYSQKVIVGGKWVTVSYKHEAQP